MPTPNENQAQAVENLQRYLRMLHFSEPNIPQPPIDGIFDDATEDSLRIFQRSRGLPDTGRADQKTWELLFDAYRAALTLGTLPASIDLFPTHPRDYTLAEGSRGFAVTALQYLLGELQHTYGDRFPTPTTGAFGKETTAAVRNFQLRNALPPNGIVDLLTWNRIVDQYNTLFQSYASE